MMDAKEVKSKLLHYFRFCKGYHWAATEVGGFNADVMVANYREIIECEVKVSKADLKNEFKKKTKIRKHEIYCSNRQRKHVPNKFYFAVPLNLVRLALKYTKDTPYGVILVSSTPMHFEVPNKRSRRTRKIKTHEVYCKIRKEAQLLQQPAQEHLKRKIFLRMSSELTRMHIKGIVEEL